MPRKIGYSLILFATFSLFIFPKEAFAQIAPTVDLKVNNVDGISGLPYNSTVNLSWITGNSPIFCTLYILTGIGWVSLGDQSVSTPNVTTGQLAGPATYYFGMYCFNNAGISNFDWVSVGINAIPAQSCPTTCHSDTQYVPDGNGGQTTCPPNQPSAQSCPTTCHSDTQYVYDGTSCTQTGSCPPNAPAAQSCPTTCHSDTQYVPNGSCGQTTCPPNNTARVEPPACRTTGGTLSDGLCSTYTYSANCTGVCSGDTCITAPTAPTVDLKVNGLDGPVTIDNGGSATISWTTTNSPTSCTGSDSWSWTNSATGGSDSVSSLFGPIGYKLTITCSNIAGSASDSVEVNVNGPPEVLPQALIDAITAALKTQPSL